MFFVKNSYDRNHGSSDKYAQPPQLADMRIERERNDQRQQKRKLDRGERREGLDESEQPHG